MYGISSFFGIINPPNAGILSVGATKELAGFDADGNVCKQSVMNIGFSGDHRVADGAVAADFLRAMKRYLETPALMLV
jgi:pyruvate dehydrogenase E2 component (dihydrolipoamide acetyltransferase)